MPAVDTSPFTIEGHAEYMPRGGGGATQAELREVNRQTAERYVGAYERDPVEVGQAIVSTLVRTMESADQQGLGHSERAALLRDLDTFYEVVANGNWRLIRSGALAEYGALNALEGYARFYPTVEEDCERHVDFWVDLEEPTEAGCSVLAVQVKSLPLREAPDQLLFVLDTPDDVERLADRHAGLLSDLDLFKSGLQGMLDFCGGFDNVTPVCVVLPSPGASEHSFVNVMTGEVSSELPRLLQAELEERIIFAGDVQ